MSGRINPDLIGHYSSCVARDRGATTVDLSQYPPGTRFRVVSSSSNVCVDRPGMKVASSATRPPVAAAAAWVARLILIPVSDPLLFQSPATGRKSRRDRSLCARN